MGIDLLAVERPQQIAHNNNARIDDITNDNRFEFTLSVSKDVVLTKDDGKYVTDFEPHTYSSTDESALTALFTTHCYSANTWHGTSVKRNYHGMTGVVLDYDHDCTIEAAKLRFKDFNYILHTSTSHQAKVPKSDRFRVFLPFAPGPARFATEAEHTKVYGKLMDANPEADHSCTNAGSKFFPHSNDLGSAFELYVNSTGKYFDVDISDVPDDVVATRTADYQPHEELGTKEELQRVLKFCPVIQWCIERAEEGLPEPLWYAMISNLCRFEGGKELIHQISSQDKTPGRYDFDRTEDKIQHAIESSDPIGYNSIARWGWLGQVPTNPYSPAGWGKLGRKGHGLPVNPEASIDLQWDDALIVMVDNCWTVTHLDQLKHDLLPVRQKLRAVCPVCDCDTAVVREDSFHFAHVWCDTCHKAYYEAPVSPNMYVYKNRILRVESRSGKFIGMEALEEASFRSEGSYKYAKKKLLTDPDRKFLEDNFQIRRMGSGDIAELDYEVKMDDNAMVFKYPALPTVVQDNAFVDHYIERMFGQYANFIRDWMALYAYTNYVKLPVIVLTGSRGCGKNTFAEMVGNIFPTLMGLWEGTKERFNEYYKNKLLFVDENPNADKPMQYVEIKKLTGNKILRIDEKFIPAYNTPNNLNIIIATNDPRPMFLKAREEPKSENTNNFFIYRCPDVDPEAVNNRLGDQLQERLGYYVRTELKARHIRLMGELNINSRYALPTPLTPLTKDLFASAKTMVESEAEELAQYLVCGIDLPDPRSAYASNIKFDPTIHEGARYVQQKDVRDLVVRLNFQGSKNPKAYLNALQDTGVISYKDDYRNSKQRLGYQILRSPDYYTTTVSGVQTTVVATSKYDILDDAEACGHRTIFQ